MVIEEGGQIEDFVYDLSQDLPNAQRLYLAIELCRFGIDRMKRYSIGKKVAEALDFYFQRGIALADVHLGNLGKVRRNGKEIVVITDPGHAVFLDDGTNLGEAWYS